MCDRTRNQRSREGFTLIELMVVVIVLAVLAATIIPQFAGTTHDAKVSKAKTDIATLKGALERFAVYMDRYPNTEEGLEALANDPTQGGSKWRGPYIEEVLLDPWDHEYHYTCPGNAGRSFDLVSHGADGEPGGEGNNEDITSWRKDREKG